MNPYLAIPNLPPGKFRVGQAVRLKHLFDRGGSLRKRARAR
jgi:hypothetical protein